MILGYYQIGTKQALPVPYSKETLCNSSRRATTHRMGGDASRGGANKILWAQKEHTERKYVLPAIRRMCDGTQQLTQSTESFIKNLIRVNAISHWVECRVEVLTLGSHICLDFAIYNYYFDPALFKGQKFSLEICSHRAPGTLIKRYGIHLLRVWSLEIKMASWKHLLLQSSASTSSVKAKMVFSTWRGGA